MIMIVYVIFLRALHNAALAAFIDIQTSSFNSAALAKSIKSPLRVIPSGDLIKYKD